LASARVRFIIPASERKNAGGSRSFSFQEAQEERQLNRFPSLTFARREAVSAFMHSVNGQGHGAEVLRLSGEHLQRAIQLNLAMPRSGLMPALERERGPLYGELLAGAPDAATRQRLHDDLVIVCPLLGLIAPTDLVPEYRCPVAAQIPGFGSLHQYWKGRVGMVLDRLCRGRRVFSFLPARLRALWTPKASVPEMVNVRFASRSNGGVLRTENAGAGRLAGAMIRHMVTTGSSDVTALQDWRSPVGHQYSADHSDHLEGRWDLVYVR